MQAARNSHSNEPKPTASGSTSDRILAAARSEFAEFGLAGARMERIAERAGVNKAMIYYHFDSKRNLYLEVIKDHYLQARQLMQQRTERSETIEELLTALAEVYAAVFRDLSDIRPIILQELAHPQAEVTSHIAQILGGSGIPQKVLAFLDQESRQGILQKVDARQALISFVTMNVGYYFLAPLIDRVLNITDRENFVEARKKAVVDIFLNGIRAR